VEALPDVREPLAEQATRLGGLPGAAIGRKDRDVRAAALLHLEKAAVQRVELEKQGVGETQIFRTGGSARA
jgi:hypothetical protein